MKVERIIIKSFCKSCQDSVAFKLDQSLRQDLIPLFTAQGFVEITHFTKCNIFYMEGPNLIASGVFGQNTIQIMCKKAPCQNFINDFEELLTKI